MAFYSNKLSAPPERSAFARALTRIKRVAVRILAARDRSADIVRLQSLDDDDLGRIGLTRNDIMRHVYRDIYYI
jgi:uncharacterized protein YjiS (DUF1127 family)